MRTFRVLGPLAVLDDGREAPLRSPHQRRLLAALLLYAGQPVTAHTLVDALWEDDPPPSATGTLLSYVSRLRLVIGRDQLRRVGPGYLLAVDATAVDATRFATTCTGAHGAPTAAVRLRLLDEALALWHGDPYADLPGLPAARAEAVRLTELRDSGREDRAEALLELGRFAAAAAEMRAMTVSHPLRERPWRLMMLALHRSGRQAEAVTAFRRYDALLAEEGLTPSSSIAALRTAILADPDGLRGPEPTTAAVPRRRALLPPRPSMSLIGREDDLARLLEHQHRGGLTTLTGPAGVGKSRLALEAATRDAATHLDGACVVVLAGVSGELDLCHTIARELGITLTRTAGADRPVDSLVDALTGWDLLLVLDGAEHVVGAVADLAARVLRRCHGVVVVVTSQERLAVNGEQVMPAGPLGTAGSDSPAVRLFLERADGVSPGFSPGPDGLADVEALCAHLDGLPLALEMAAARTASFTPRELLDRVDRRFSLLRGVRATDGDRHATLRAAIDWSYRLLEPGEQDLFAAMSVFPAPFDADGAASVSVRPPDDVRHGLAVLVERSMVTADLGGRRARFTLLETLRAYGSEVLAANGTLDATRSRHARWAVAGAERADAALRGAGEAEAVADLDAAVPHLRAAYDHALAVRDIPTVDRLTTALLVYAYHRLALEPADWATAAVAALDGAAPASVLALAAIGHVNRGDIDTAERLADDAMRGSAAAAARRMAAVILADAALYRGDLDGVGERCRENLDCDDPLLRALAHQTAGTADAYRGRTASAREHAGHVRDLARGTGSPSISAWADYLTGEALADEQPARALPHLRAAVASAGRVGNRLIEGVAIVAATACSIRHDEPDLAGPAVVGAIAHWQRTGDRTHQWPTLRTAAILLSRLGRHEAATTVAAAVSTSAPPPYGKEADDLAAVSASALRHLGPAATRAAQARGATFDADEVASFAMTALALPDALDPASSPPERSA